TSRRHRATDTPAPPRAAPACARCPARPAGAPARAPSASTTTALLLLYTIRATCAHLRAGRRRGLPCLVRFLRRPVPAEDVLQAGARSGAPRGRRAGAACGG